MTIETALTGASARPNRRAVVAISFGTALVVIDNSVATVALPTISHALGVTRSASVMIVTVYQMVLLMTVLPFSALGDRIGLKRLYQGGQTLFLVATIASSLSTTLPSLLAARACQALGVGAALSVGTALLRRIYPPEQLGRGFGLNGIIIACASAFAPTLGGFLLSLGSWRFVFATAAPFAAFSLLLGRSLPPQQPTRPSYDLPGAILSAGTFGLLVGGLQVIALGAALPVAGALLLLGTIVGLLFVRRELNQSRPILPVDLLARTEFAFPVLAALAAFAGQTMYALSLPFMIQAHHHTGPAQIGSILAAWPLAMLAVAPLSGALVSRVPGGLLTSLGMAGTAIGLGLTVVIGTAASPYWLIVPLMLGGGGFGFFIAPNAHQIMTAAPPERSASAGALTTTTRLVGSTLGATLLASLLILAPRQDLLPTVAAAGLVTLAGLFSLCNLNAQVRRRSKEDACARSVI